MPISVKPVTPKTKGMLKRMEERFAKVIIGDSRKMLEIGDSTVDLVVISPPYWRIKDYGAENQIGYNHSLHQYLEGIFHIWKGSV